MIRAFIAIQVAPALLEKIRAEQGRLQTSLRGEPVRWTGPDQLHLTLQFLGNVPEDAIDSLKAAVRKACQGTPPLQLVLAGLGCFPSPQRPSVVWLGLEGDVGLLEQLQARIERETERYINHSENRRFHAHLTIGRVRSGEAGVRQVGRLMSSTRVEVLGNWRADHVDLVRSQLNPSGSVYTTLERVELERTSSCP